MFDVVYEIPSGTATDADLSAAGEVTVQYLQDFLTAQFDFNAVTQLESVEGTVVGTSSADTSAMLEISLIFSNDSQILPSMDDILSLLFTAFQQPFVNGLITMLGTELPPSNPLSGSTQVQAVLP